MLEERNTNCFDIISAIKNFKISPRTLNHLHDVQVKFNQYLTELLSLGNETAVHHLMIEFYNELMYSNKIEGETDILPASVMNCKLMELATPLNSDGIQILQEMIMQTQKTPIKTGYRNKPVFIPTVNDFNQLINYQAPDPSLVPNLMEEFIDFYNRNSDGFIDNDPFIKSALLHILFVSIHPLIDGNGRTARLIHSLKFTELVNRTYSYKNQKLDLQICPANISYNISHSKYSYCQKLAKIQTGKKEDLNEALNNFINFLLFMYEEQFEHISNSQKLEETKHLLSDNDIIRLLSLVFTDIHYGCAISEEEWERDRKWERENNSIINQAKKIIEQDPKFDTLPYETQVKYAAYLLKQLKSNTQSEIERKQDFNLSYPKKVESKKRTFNDDIKRRYCRLFTDEHYGAAITENELQEDREWEKENISVISQAKQIIKDNKEFESLSLEEKIDYVKDLIEKLKSSAWIEDMQSLNLNITKEQSQSLSKELQSLIFEYQEDDNIECIFCSVSEDITKTLSVSLVARNIDLVNISMVRDLNALFQKRDALDRFGLKIFLNVDGAKNYDATGARRNLLDRIYLLGKSSILYESTKRYSDLKSESLQHSKRMAFKRKGN